MPRLLIIGIALVAALGGLIYGVDSGIIGTTLGQDTFKLYMFGPTKANPALLGAIVSCYNAGQAVGSASAGYLADKFSRKYTILLAAILAAGSAAIQAGSVNVGMMIAGRAIAGFACGQILSVVPIYIAEISPPKQRGFVVGLQGMAIACGFAIANWIGYGGSYASGDAQWRITLSMQIPAAVCLAVGIFFVPFSPRWLIQQDRHEEARRILLRFHDTDEDHDLVNQEMIQIREQMNFEKMQNNPSWFAAVGQLFSRQYLRRTMTASFILTMSQLSGSQVIQNFQNIFYATAGFKGQQALLISGIYGLMGVIGQVIYLVFVADRWPRARTMWTGSLVLCVMISICMALSAIYGHSAGDLSGARGAIAFIFLYSMAYAIFFNAMIWVLSSEMFPFFLRSKGVAVAVFTKAVVAIILSQITPLAIAAVSWRYYSLFIATNFAAAVIYFFFLPETSGKSLEEIAELFGDTLATGHIGEIDIDAKGIELGEPLAEHRSRV
ncbi:general substrate transporter [Hypoxylon rubiginosum]|uniref:General substrate transporter n=1 Tax=Hypoxylon rubiginosum TaxID=110542 RepID=A0ACB9YWL0_9PEZI|nr:general substrate transporter [Hypoxylon rubiginosum]